MMICIIGLSFIIAMFMVAFSCRVKKENKEFIDSLTSEQLRIYENIKSQRWNIFLNASLAGILAGVISIFIYTQSSKSSSPMTSAFVFLSTAFTVQYFFYILSPKDKWIVTTLDTEEQRKEWKDTYSAYQSTYHLGLLLGLIGYFISGYGLNKLITDYN